MKNFLHITEVAVFSIDRFTFGIDTAQIQEILRVNAPQFLAEAEENSPFLMLQHSRGPLLVFDVRQRFRLNHFHADSLLREAFLTLITFYKGGFLIACPVTSVNDVIPVSMHLLQPIPPILTASAQKNGIWGFYETSTALLPLLDPEHLISFHELQQALAFLR